MFPQHLSVSRRLLWEYKLALYQCYQLIMILGTRASQWAASLLTTARGYNSTPSAQVGEKRASGTADACGQGHLLSPETMGPWPDLRRSRGRTG